MPNSIALRRIKAPGRKAPDEDRVLHPAVAPSMQVLPGCVLLPSCQVKAVQGTVSTRATPSRHSGVDDFWRGCYLAWMQVFGGGGGRAGGVHFFLSPRETRGAHYGWGTQMKWETPIWGNVTALEGLHVTGRLFALVLPAAPYVEALSSGWTQALRTSPTVGPVWLLRVLIRSIPQVIGISQVARGSNSTLKRSWTGLRALP